ncbi:MAG TPA: helix-turn-helix transcriptional regulator [Ginsengibacter sp.]
MNSIVKKQQKKKATIAFADVEDKIFGKIGTPQRLQYDAELNEEIIGELIKQARQKQNLTQQELATKLGVHKSNISKMEHNVKSMRIDTMMKVLNVLNAKVSIQVTLPTVKKKLKIA